MTFEEAIAALSALAPRGWRLGLERMQAFAEAAGLRDALGSGTPQYIQVAGTNGKGSVTATLQSLLVEQGYRTGAYFSPYVYDPRERIQLGRELISHDRFAELAARLLPIADALGPTFGEGATEFEVKTAMGLTAWKEAVCEWVALEVGLGGRLDATSVVSPACGVVVSIGLDHVSILGDTKEAIAAEKVGILKPGMPLVLGAMDPGPRQVCLAYAREMGSTVWEFGREVVLEGSTLSTPGQTYHGLVPVLQGAVQPHNMALAVAALELSGALRDPSAVAVGVARVSLPGRFEQRTVRGKRVVLDGAHNAPSGEMLAKSLQALNFDRLILVTGMLTGHDPREFYHAFEPFRPVAHTTPIHFGRTRTAEEVAEALGQATTHPNAEQAIMTALDEAGPEDLILVTGSFYLVGEVGAILASLS